MSEFDSSVASFRNLLSYLDSDLQAAEKKYIEIQNRLMMMFERSGCRDPYVLAVETLKRVESALWKGVKIEKNIYAFTFAVKKNVLKEYYKDPQRHEYPMGEGTEFTDKSALQDTWGLDEEQLLREARIDCLERCLSDLAPETKALFLEYYGETQGKKKDSRKEIITKLGLNLNALRQRLHRIKKDLYACIQACLKANSTNR